VVCVQHSPASPLQLQPAARSLALAAGYAMLAVLLIAANCRGSSGQLLSRPAAGASAAVRY